MKKFNENISYEIGERSYWNGSPRCGVAKYTSITIDYKGQKKAEEWQWRDAYSPCADRFDLYINGVGQIEERFDGDKVVVTIELIGDRGQTRRHSFDFDNFEVAKIEQELLSDENAALFAAEFGNEILRLFSEANKLWALKPGMLDTKTADGKKPYDTPRVVHQLCNPRIGVGAFVIEQQIDHDGDDRQHQHELFLLTGKGCQARQLAEDHSYDKREGGSRIEILNLTQNEIEIVLKGTRTILKF